MRSENGEYYRDKQEGRRKRKNKLDTEERKKTRRLRGEINEKNENEKINNRKGNKTRMKIKRKKIKTE